MLTDSMLAYYRAYVDNEHDVWMFEQPYNRTAMGWLRERGETIRLRGA